MTRVLGTRVDLDESAHSVVVACRACGWQDGYFDALSASAAATAHWARHHLGLDLFETSCRVSGCMVAPHARGLCNSHYRSALRAAKKFEKAA